MICGVCRREVRIWEGMQIFSSPKAARVFAPRLHGRASCNSSDLRHFTCSLSSLSTFSSSAVLHAFVLSSPSTLSSQRLASSPLLYTTDTSIRFIFIETESSGGRSTHQLPQRPTSRHHQAGDPLFRRRRAHAPPKLAARRGRPCRKGIRRTVARGSVAAPRPAAPETAAQTCTT
jgi:hypothetical protein